MTHHDWVAIPGAIKLVDRWPPRAPGYLLGICFGKANEHGLRSLQITFVEWKHVATHLTTFPKWQELCDFTGQVPSGKLT